MVSAVCNLNIEALHNIVANIACNCCVAILQFHQPCTAPGVSPITLQIYVTSVDLHNLIYILYASGCVDH